VGERNRAEWEGGNKGRGELTREKTVSVLSYTEYLVEENTTDEFA
jgi:hypothetical protein